MTQPRASALVVALHGHRVVRSMALVEEKEVGAGHGRSVIRVAMGLSLSLLPLNS